MSSIPDVLISAKVSMKIEKEEEEQQLRCRGCGSNAFLLDWKAGDRVCTNCGTVDEEHIRDTRPEWKDFNEVEDLAKGLPSLQRCSLMPNDESKYIGGLQPTILSRNIFGNPLNNEYSNNGSNINTSTRLLKTHRKINRVMDKLHATKVRELQYNRKIKRSNKDFGIKEEEEEDATTTILDNNTVCIQTKKDEYASSFNNALIGSKWSLQRAVMLHGSYDESLSLSSQQQQLSYNQYCKEKDELSHQITSPNKIASQEVYHAYILTVNAIRQLLLPTHFITDCMHITCQYAMNRDGFHVKGISTRYKEEIDEDSISTSSISASTVKEKKLQIKHKNKIQQIASLSCAVIYIFAKKNGYAKSLSHVCSTFIPTQEQQGLFLLNKTTDSLVRPKSCSKAIAQLQIDFPTIFQSLLSPSVEVVNLVKSTTSSLDLPIVAIDVIREVVRFIAKQHLLDNKSTSKKQDNAKLVTICAACTYFVCCAGEVMQRLAAQALKKQERQQQSSGKNNKKRHRSSSISSPKKRSCATATNIVIKQEYSSSSLNITPAVTPEPTDIKVDQGNNIPNTNLDPSPQPELTTSLVSLTSNSKFDIFSEKQPIDNNPVIEGWHAWNNNNNDKKWNRSMQQIQQSCHCNASTTPVILKFFKYKLFPIREQILNTIQDYFVRRIEEEGFYGFSFVDIKIAAPLMKNS